MRRDARPLVVLAALAGAGILAVAPWAGAQPYRIFGAETSFTVTWEAARWRGKPSVTGYVTNTHGLGAINVRLLVEHLDAGGAVTATTVGHVPDLVPPGGRVYFEVLVPMAAPAYRVSVLSYEWRSGPSG